MMIEASETDDVCISTLDKFRFHLMDEIGQDEKVCPLWVGFIREWIADWSKRGIGNANG